MSKTIETKGNITATMRRSTKFRLMLFGTGGQTFDAVLNSVMDRLDKKR